jgi:glyoxylase-like metal-dependent hydrolase (beta-lactamase superfamily II)
VPPEILMIPLLGHTRGHAGVVVRREGRWLLQAGDAYFFHAEMDLEHPWCTPGLRFYLWMMQEDAALGIASQERLRALKRAHGGGEVCCGHDLVEFERLAGRSAELPADALSVDVRI